MISAYNANIKVIMVPDLSEPDEELNKKLYMKLNTIDEIKKIYEK